MLSVDCERLIAFNGVILRRWCWCCLLLLLCRYGVDARTNSDDLFRGVSDDDTLAYEEGFVLRLYR